MIGLGLALCSVASAVAQPAARGSKTVNFNRDIRPILSENCFHCHGPDQNKRKAKLRLDTPEGATAERDGTQAIKPKDINASELWKRINTTDPDDHMPPAKTGKKLKPEQIALLKKWIEEGAEYQGHWAFVPPNRPSLPAVKNRRWARNGIDYFIAEKFEAKQLSPNPEASRESLIRRVSFDLTGLPPTPEEVDAFLQDQRPDAYEQLVDRLLRSPFYGEHMARFWLDAARYGDTHGLHLDNERSMWPYRDWVVAAFNHNLPFDQFTIEQIAGDLLPNPTRDQLIASGFNRCNISTSEGGAIEEEFYVRYAVDRVETTSAVWLGLTAGCAVCHDHKFDPISQKEFYQLFSFFNNATEKAMDGNALLPQPILKLPTPDEERQLKDYDVQIAAIEAKVKEKLATLTYTDPATLTNAAKVESVEVIWLDDEFPAKATPKTNEGTPPAKWVSAPAGPVFSGTRALQRTDQGLAQDFFLDAEPWTVGAGDRFFAYVYLDPTNSPKAVMLQFHSTDWLYRANWGDAEAIPYEKKEGAEKFQAGPLPETGKWVRLEVDAVALGIRPGTLLSGLAFTQFGGTVAWDKAGQLAVNDPLQDPARSQLAWEKFERRHGKEKILPKEVLEAIKADAAKRDDKQKALLRDYYLENVFADTWPLFEPLHAELKSVRDKRTELDKVIVATMVMKELEKPRGAFILKRGQYDKRGEEVGPGVPAVLPPLPKSSATNRLNLARWLIDPKHPLTARVTVNRFWQQFFGTAIVKTASDFGSQGEWPSHPELLDWLATEFIADGWNVRELVRLIVTSATYRQDSRVTSKHLAVDPENRLLARGPRFRFDAESLRDNALFVSGLLNLKMGGRGVRPYQPPGIWEAVAYTTSTTSKYTQDKGDALYRRSLYTFWKRTAPPASMTTFDAPSRESCVVRRERTNTPLQALLLMNDPQFVEASRHLGARMIRQGGKSDADRLKFGFRLVTARQPTAREHAVLKQALEAQRAKYQADLEAAKQLIAVGESAVNPEVNPSELASYTMVANLLLNLDEVVTKN